MKLKTVLVTGVNGFVGRHLVDRLINDGFNVTGTGITDEADPLITAKLTDYWQCDLTDESDVASLVLEKIDYIINLAGLAKAGGSDAEVAKYLETNSAVHTNIYDQLLARSLSPKILAISSAHIYDPTASMPLTEDSLSADDDKMSAYALSKKLLEKNIQPYIKKGLPITIIRPFNHIGPGQTPGFLLPDLCVQIKQAVESHSALLVGDLSTKRDYTDVRDVVAAYSKIITTDNFPAGETYNICSGTSRSGDEIVDLLLAQFGAKNIETKIDPSKLRKNDIQEIYGTYSKLHNLTGWRPEVEFSRTISDIVAEYL